MSAWINSPLSKNNVPTASVPVSAGYSTLAAALPDQPDQAAKLVAPAGTTYDLTIGITGPNGYADSKVFLNVTGSSSKNKTFTVPTVPGEYTVYCDLTKNTSKGSANFGHDSQSPIYVGKGGGVVTTSSVVDGTDGITIDGGPAAAAGGYDGDFLRAVKHAAAQGAAGAVAAGLRPVVLAGQLQPGDPAHPRVGLVVEVYHIEPAADNKFVPVVDFTAIPTVFGRDVSAVFPAAARLHDRQYRFTILYPLGKSETQAGGPVT